MVTLESVLEYHNMRTAMTQVIKNRGAAGFDVVNNNLKLIHWGCGQKVGLDF